MALREPQQKHCAETTPQACKERSKDAPATFALRNQLWLGMMLAFGVRLVDLGQNLLEMMLRVFQYKGTFASVAVTCAALMPCSGHRSVFRGTGTVEKVRLLPAAWLKRTAGFGGPLGG